MKLGHLITTEGRLRPFPDGQLYHLSEKPLTHFLEPRVPDNFLTREGYEDSVTPRVSASSTVDGALRALSTNLKGKKLFVYVLRTKAEVVKPTVKQVPDCKITDELWILGTAKPELIGRIEVHEAIDKQHPYYYGPHKAELYSWNWSQIPLK